MIKILSFCAALLAPESTGLDPHGRALHLELHADFNTSYEACITTSKQARKYGIDPFVSAALMYKITKFSPELARKSRIFRKIRQDYGCSKNSGQFIRSSCSSFMLFAPHLADILQKSVTDPAKKPDYHTSIQKFIDNNHRKAKIIENIAKRFADTYSRTHTYFSWSNPFYNSPKVAENRPQHRQEHHNSDLYSMIDQLRQPRPYDYQRRRLERRMQYDLSILHQILGPNVRIEAKSRDYDHPEYFIHINYRDLKDILIYSAGRGSSRLKPHAFKEYDGETFVLLLKAPNLSVKFIPQGENLYFVTIK